jgi:hypothetical protein
MTLAIIDKVRQFFARFSADIAVAIFRELTPKSWNLFY